MGEDDIILNPDPNLKLKFEWQSKVWAEQGSDWNESRAR